MAKVSTVSTVLGEISPEALGQVLIHEHIVCIDPALAVGFGEKWMPLSEVADRAVEMLKLAYRCGVRTIIDGTPLDLGRNVPLMQEVSRLSGVQIVASTGIYYTEHPGLRGKDPERFARFFLEECENGIGNTGVRPGILKCATDEGGLTEINRIQIMTMGIVQRESGLPLFAHNAHHRQTAIPQLKLLLEMGANPRQIILGHASDSRDIGYLESLLQNGCCLGFDRIFEGSYREQAAVIAELLRRGWEDQILLSHDKSCFIDFGDTDWERTKRSPLEPGFTLVHTRLLPALRELGATERQLEKLLCENPRRMLTER